MLAVLSLSAVLVGGYGASPPPLRDRIVLNEREYFEAPGFAFLLFHNNYQEGFFGGLEMIQGGERVLAAGDLMLKRKGDQEHTANPGPATNYATLTRQSDPQHATATVRAKTLRSNTSYRLICRTDGKRLYISVALEQPINWEDIAEAGFRIYLDPAVYASRSFLADTRQGLLPREYSGTSTLASGTVMRIASEDSSRAFTIARRGGIIRLIDERRYSRESWFSLVAPFERGSSESLLQIEITPSINPSWRRQPVIGVSQVGYHPKQRKQAVLMLDAGDQVLEAVKLYRLDLAGGKTLVKSAIPRAWGKLLRDRYALFDFTEVKQPGLYLLEFRNRVAGPFQISPTLYDHLWEPTLECFLPVQMCHVAVREGERTWHGACHLDDALQAPEGTKFRGQYQQGPIDTKFAGGAHIPGLNWGGWHDAGDQQVPGGSVAYATLVLALAQEEFQPDLDRTSVMRSTRQVLLHTPDGKPDLLQQIEYGAEGLLASYRAAGHIFPGIIETNWNAYAHAGDPVNITDNLVYDAALKPDERTGDRSGTPDDRWVFTNRSTGLDYQTAQALAAASRALRNYHSDLAAECLAAAETLWSYEQTHAPSAAVGSYVPDAGDVRLAELAATAELFLTTRNDRYRERLTALQPNIRALSAAEFGRGPGWTLVRLLPTLPEGELRTLILDGAREWKRSISELQRSNPYGVESSRGTTAQWKLESPATEPDGIVWGSGWTLLEEAMHNYYLGKNVPQLSDTETLCSALNYVLGVHPASNEPYIAGMGFSPGLTAYALNRDDWSYVPGGVVSGATLVKPDFWEFKQTPFLWYEREIVMSGAVDFLFDVLAVRKLLGS
jgi:hypothetical protein